MIRSMTGFGRSTIDLLGTAFDVEVRSVNHRYLDLRVRLPRVLAGLEPNVRERVQGRFARGKVEVSVQAPPGAAAATRIEVDYEAAGQYLAAAREIERRFGLGVDLDAEDLLSLPGVSRVVEDTLDGGEAEPALLAGVEEALAAAVSMRALEGEALEREFRERLDRVAALVADLGTRAGSVQEAVRERLRKRARELQAETGLADEARLHQEIVVAADRLDVAEEISRLRSHVDQFRSVLDAAEAGQPVGRRLDFLLQELGREGNTLGSKANDAEMAHAVVELKTELERIREQVQNVE
jgi:uncharacterized protein (TIGR00255 family)